MSQGQRSEDSRGQMLTTMDINRIQKEKIKTYQFLLCSRRIRGQQSNYIRIKRIQAKVHPQKEETLNKMSVKGCILAFLKSHKTISYRAKIQKSKSKNRLHQNSTWSPRVSSRGKKMFEGKILKESRSLSTNNIATLCRNQRESLSLQGNQVYQMGYNIEETLTLTISSKDHPRESMKDQEHTKECSTVVLFPLAEAIILSSKGSNLSTETRARDNLLSLSFL